MNIDKLNEDYRMPFAQYLDNPTKFKGNLATNMSSIKAAMDMRYDKLISKFGDDFKINIYDNSSNKILIHIQSPSEKYKGLLYDTVYECETTDVKNVKDLKFRVYCNNPEFCFTYAYVFGKRNLLIEELKNKYEKEVIKKNPSIRNYYEIVSISPTLYFTMRYLLSKYGTVDELLKDKKDKPRLFDFKIKTVINRIHEYKKLQKQEAKERRREKEEKKKEMNLSRPKHQTTRVKEDKHVKMVNKVNSKNKISGKSKIAGKSKIRSKSKIR